ncbi:hypothetical protein HanXRQr2_Chr13g0570701 [Helianthus annuus]|uniref:DUF4283 domain-containing protein n=2 Tax=Helianthus annuus TaxID=4232 RepID=A0A9K3H8S4_HELAN|nr:hypothetical protein HanXRQr2_Chr13g0570701 [Helianthus annuus]KAJ0496420.1 hypothetical protein HanHA89_Chr13g0499551 [Helianthus annuus]
MGGCKLKVNIARFANENTSFWESDVKYQEKADHPIGKKLLNENRGGSNKFRTEGVSYRDMLAPKTLNIPVSGMQQPVGKIERVLEVHEETSAFFAFQEKAVVGRASDVKSLTALNEWLCSSGFLSAKVYYVGGLFVLVVFPEDYEAVEFLNNRDVWKDWFSSLDMWEGQSLPYERIAWIKFVGVPVHLAENKAFNDLAEVYGKVVHASQLSAEDRDLSVNRVGVLVEHGDPIKDTAILSWKGRRYKVWLSEEQRDWIPDCLVEVSRPVPAVGAVEESQTPLEVHGKSKRQEDERVIPCMRREAEVENCAKGNDEGGPALNRMFYSQAPCGSSDSVGPKILSQVVKKKTV